MAKADPKELIFREPDLDCRQIFTCGQCFRWKEENGWWKGVAGGRYLKIRSDGVTVTVIGADRRDFDLFWRGYFDLDTDYSAIKRYLSGIDPNLEAATRFGGGIRLLRQEPFETLISFIISANNNIPRIGKCVETLCRRYGKAIGADPDNGEAVYAFPEPEALARLSAEEISDVCHAGYRSPYIVKAARQYIDRGGDISEPETYTGVGPKVAACVKLFTGADMDSFPVDVWVRRLISELYFTDLKEGEEPSLRRVNEFIKEHFTKYGGYAQQYLFYWRRESGR